MTTKTPKTQAIAWCQYSIKHRQPELFMVFKTAGEAIEFWTHPGCEVWNEIDNVTPPVTACCEADLAHNGLFDDPSDPEIIACIEAVKAGKTVTYFAIDPDFYWGEDKDEILREFCMNVPTGDDVVSVYDEGEELPEDVRKMMEENQ
jgi:hypothetical protein